AARPTPSPTTVGLARASAHSPRRHIEGARGPLRITGTRAVERPRTPRALPPAPTRGQSAPTFRADTRGTPPRREAGATIPAPPRSRSGAGLGRFKRLGLAVPRYGLGDASRTSGAAGAL